MRLAYDAYLCRKFPHLFAARGDAMSVTCMCWGFDCMDGWYKIIKEASEKLEPLIVDWIKKHPKEKNFFPRASQVKEKYGMLCFYLTHGTDEMYAIAEAAERKSTEICETCGKPGKLRGWHWLYTACDKHAKGEH